jgi:hypothetical protein
MPQPPSRNVAGGSFRLRTLLIVVVVGVDFWPSASQFQPRESQQSELQRRLAELIKAMESPGDGLRHLSPAEIKRLRANFQLEEWQASDQMSPPL